MRMKAVGRTDAERLESAKAVVASNFGWQRITETTGREFYATDSQGDVLWLKARTERYPSMSWDGITSDQSYDALIGILVSPDASPDADITLVIRVPKALTEDLKHNKVTTNPRLRWNDEAKAAVEYLWRSDK